MQNKGKVPGIVTILTFQKRDGMGQSAVYGTAWYGKHQAHFVQYGTAGTDSLRYGTEREF